MYCCSAGSGLFNLSQVPLAVWLGGGAGTGGYIRWYDATQFRFLLSLDGRTVQVAKAKGMMCVSVEPYTNKRVCVCVCVCV